MPGAESRLQREAQAGLPALPLHSPAEESQPRATQGSHLQKAQEELDPGLGPKCWSRELGRPAPGRPRAPGPQGQLSSSQQGTRGPGYNEGAQTQLPPADSPSSLGRRASCAGLSKQEGLLSSAGEERGQDFRHGWIRRPHHSPRSCLWVCLRPCPPALLGLGTGLQAPGHQVCLPLTANWKE